MALNNSKQIASSLVIGFVLVGNTSLAPTTDAIVSDIGSMLYTASVSSGHQLEPFSAITELDSTIAVYEINSETFFGSMTNMKGATDQELWAEMDALYGIWADREEINDDWLDSLRGRSNSRFTEIYGDQWE